MLIRLPQTALMLLLATAFSAQAQAPAPALATDPTAEALSSAPPEALHTWQAALPKLVNEAYFTNITDGEKVEAPFLVKFGLSGGWGLAPISSPAKGKSGHHHMLVDRPLPLNFKSALPFTEQYIHFGKGQMESVLSFPPGTYTLRMLLANQQHLPYFVYSKPTTITVTKKNSTDPKSLQTKGIDLLIEDDAEFKPPFRIQFHASSLNVAHMSQKEKDTGHFRLTVTPKSGAASVMNFVNGQTEVWLVPPAGNYRVQLEMIDNAEPSHSLAPPVTKNLKVL